MIVVFHNVFYHLQGMSPDLTIFYRVLSDSTTHVTLLAMVAARGHLDLGLLAPLLEVALSISLVVLILLAFRVKDPLESLGLKRIPLV